MDDGNLTKLLWQDSSEVPEATPFCPDDQVIVRYFEGALGEAERERLRNHLADCRYCLARLGNLARSLEIGHDPQVPAQVLAEAKQKGKQAAPVKQALPASAWAAVAMAVLAIALVLSGPWDRPPGDEAVDTAGGDAARQLRSLGSVPREIRMVDPAPGGLLSAGATVRWLEVPGVDRYDVFVLSASGDVVWTERLLSAEWSPQVRQGLIPGNHYFLRIEAILQDGSALSSRHVAFRFTEP